MGLAGAAVGLLTGGMELAFPPTASAQSTLTPDEALAELMAGNKRFISGQLTSFDHDLAILKQHTVDKQEPFAAVLSCADSRVPVELVFDQSIGHIFVTRVAGNMITPEIIGSLEYGAAVLGVKVILVMGHSGCGAVKATMARQRGTRPDQLSVSSHPAGRGSGWIESGSGDQSECSDPGDPVARGIDRDCATLERCESKSGRRLLRPGQRRCGAARVTAYRVPTQLSVG